MSSSSPEQEQISTMLSALKSTLDTVDPIERKAHFHMSVTNDGDLDEAIRTLAYRYETDHINDSYEDLSDFFQQNYDVAAPFLADMWNIDQQNVPWPEESSQNAACYFTSYKGEEYLVRIANWCQPTPNDSETAIMLAVSFEPAWSDDSTIRVIYYDGEPLVSCKYSAVARQQLVLADWSDTGELNPDDVMHAQKLAENIPFQEFDTTP